MVNRQRFMLDDIDSEGFAVAKPRTARELKTLNIGRTNQIKVDLANAILADIKCGGCPPDAETIELAPVGWRWVNGEVHAAHGA